MQPYRLLPLVAWPIACLLMPPAVYLAGTVLVGPYPGSDGLSGLSLSVYRDALQGQPAAWLLLTTPVLLGSLWSLTSRLIRPRAR